MKKKHIFEFKQINTNSENKAWIAFQTIVFLVRQI